MIDTDKYEGHSPAPWKAVLNDTDGHMDVVIGTCLSKWCFTEGDEKREVLLDLPCWVCEEDMLELTATAELIADAPLLLVEVKKLREELKQTRESLWWCYDNYRFDSHTMVDTDWNFIGNLLGADMESAESKTVTSLPKDYIPTQEELDELNEAWENGDLHFCDESITHDEENHIYLCDVCGREGDDMVFIDTYFDNFNMNKKPSRSLEYGAEYTGGLDDGEAGRNEHYELFKEYMGED